MSGFIFARPRRRTMGSIGAAALILGMATSGCRAGRENAPLPADEGPDEVIREFQRTESRSGRVTLGLDANRGDVYDRDHRVELVTMQVDFYSSDGAHMSTLTADSGHVDTRSEDMQAFGHVRVVGEDGAVLTTSFMPALLLFALWTLLASVYLVRRTRRGQQVGRRSEAVVGA